MNAEPSHEFLNGTVDEDAGLTTSVRLPCDEGVVRASAGGWEQPAVCQRKFSTSMRSKSSLSRCVRPTRRFLSVSSSTC